MDRFLITSENESIRHLSSRDKRLAKVIQTIGDIECSVQGDPFEFVVGEIVGQMLSNKVADVITDRLIDLCGGKICLETILKLEVPDLRGIGISQAKSQYILNLADAVNSGQIVFSELEELQDKDVMKKMMSIQGIGSWTSKMYLLFVLQRPNVLPFEDGAFIQAYKWLYKTDDVKPESVKKKCKKWSPYSSTAARYLYRALDCGLTKQEFHLFKKEM